MKFPILILTLFFSLVTHADELGGYMRSCYNGHFITGQTCEQRTSSASSASYSATITAWASYSQSSGQNAGDSVQVSVDIDFYDTNGYFSSFKTVTVSGYASVRGSHRSDSWKTVPFNNLKLFRDYGDPNHYHGNYTYQMTNSFGAEYAEYTEWFTLLPYGSNERMDFDLR
ncbi:MAG: hypothetical protein ACXVC3_19860 [Bdellovibrio sp.]